MSVLKPSAYHGFGKKGPYFEGWYFKNISKDGKQRWSIIPGVYIGKNPADSHSFIQFLNGVNGKSWYIDFPYSDFHADHDRFHIKIGVNEFSSDSMDLDIARDDFQSEAVLNMREPNPGQSRFFHRALWDHLPGCRDCNAIMAWFLWISQIMGSLIINNEKLVFSGGRGYMEKDWGKTMPNAWIWSQTNHFSREGVSLTFSVADIPFGPLSFNGFIAGLLLDGKLHRFATYTGARIKDISMNEHDVSITFADGKEMLAVCAKRGRTSSLHAPTISQMDRRIMETLSAQVETQLLCREGDTWKTIFKDTGPLCRSGNSRQPGF